MHSCHGPHSYLGQACSEYNLPSLPCPNRPYIICCYLLDPFCPSCPSSLPVPSTQESPIQLTSLGFLPEHSFSRYRMAWSLMASWPQVFPPLLKVMMLSIRAFLVSLSKTLFLSQALTASPCFMYLP